MKTGTLALLLAASSLAGCASADSTLSRKARTALEAVMAAELSGEDLSDPALLAPALSYFPKNGSREDRMNLYYQLGRIRFNCGDYGDAVLAFEKARVEAEAEGNLHLVGLSCRGIADCYNRTYNTREDTLYLALALSAFEASGDSLHRMETLFRTAQAYYNAFEWEKADSCFQRARPGPASDSVYLKQYCESYASFLLDAPSGDAGKALSLFERARSIDPRFTPWRLCDLGYALLLNGRDQEGEQIWNALEQAVPGPFPRLDYRKFCLYKRRGEIGQALDRLYQADIVQDSLFRAQTSETIACAQRDYMQAVAREERMQAERERRGRRAAVLGGLLLSAILLLSGGVLLEKEKARRARVQQALSDSRRLVERLEEAERRHLTRIHTLNRNVRQAQSDLEEARSEYLYLFRSGYGRLGKLFEVRHFADSQRETEKVLCEKVGEILKEIDGDRDGLRQLKRFIEEKLDRPLTHLKEDLPDLKEREIQLFCYLVIGYDASLISLLLGIDNLNTVYSRKNRLLGRIKSLPPAKARRYLALVA